jgi:hypothetical protein
MSRRSQNHQLNKLNAMICQLECTPLFGDPVLYEILAQSDLYCFYLNRIKVNRILIYQIRLQQSI